MAASQLPPKLCGSIESQSMAFPLAVALTIVLIVLSEICISFEHSPRSYSRQIGPRVHAARFRDDGPAIERTVAILYHKPRGLLTTHVSDDAILPLHTEAENKKPRGTVYSDIQSMKGFTPVETRAISSSTSFEEITGVRSKLHSIGRLDAETSGLLLFTNDGALVHHVTNPTASTHGGHSRAITKTYEAVIMGAHDDTTLKQLWSGVDLGAKYGGITKPVHDLRVLAHPTSKSTLVSVTISEGRNRQIRRMFHALNSGVMKLKRTKIGEHLTLEGLNEGQWRLLSEHEIEKCLQWKPRTLPAAKPKLSTSSKHPSTRRNLKGSHGQAKRQRR